LRLALGFGLGTVEADGVAERFDGAVGLDAGKGVLGWRAGFAGREAGEDVFGGGGDVVERKAGGRADVGETNGMGPLTKIKPSLKREAGLLSFKFGTPF